jgi:broad specificity phosphatase PhoE
VTDVVLARHGETVWHAENRYAGVSDVALTPLGEEAGRPARHVGPDTSPPCATAP